ncbi:MAG TPA: glycosyltransferase family 4 protein [Mycobacteriales bacterium]|jgi:glycosyltransferase involved in cell wall biosynthesis|nr:glycosyltransferase family 4 protein [Mycobacteriales bacterium]
MEVTSDIERIRPQPGQVAVTSPVTKRRRRRRAVPSTAAGDAHVVICTWRDLRHPEGGGSERYVETVAHGLAALGNTVTVLCSSVAGLPPDDLRDGIRYRRRGGRYTVYLHAAWALLSRQVRPDVVLDVQNGVPFLSSLLSRRPVVVLVHHVHREQWRMLFGPRSARLGWWVESRLAPVIYRRSRYIAVSEATRQDLATLGIDPARVSIIHNGTPPLPAARTQRSARPRLVVLGRLVEPKRVEIALRVLQTLRSGRWPDLELDVVGRGPHEGGLRELAEQLGVADNAIFHGFVDDQTKSDVLAAAWIHAVPSVKEGWALAVVEAGQLGTPSVGFTGAGGLSESIVNGRTGILVDGDENAFCSAIDDLLADDERRRRLGQAAREHALSFRWDTAVEAFVHALDASLDDAR